VFPVEANVVLVSRPGDLPPPPPPPAAASVEPRHNPGLLANDRLTAIDADDNDNENDIGGGGGGGGGGCQSVRAPGRRHRKRSSACNSVNVDDVVVDVHQADVKRTSVSHQRHADDREHRPKRKGNAARSSNPIVASGA